MALLTERSEKFIISSIAALTTRIEAILAAAVVGIVFLLVLPLPTWLMDTLVAMNLFLAGLLIVMSLYVKGLTSFSTFPVILLLSTLFRLGLEVAASRMILMDADAGHIVDTFGNFVVGGNLVVGLVIFIIVMVVQFIVITKGAERISEVSARFSLDAMPAKQLAIESELRTGLIDQARAKYLRAQLDVETQLLGSMDGAMKFVKGDAIAGLIIVFVNLLGGLGVGVAIHGMTLGDAIKTYSVLTIGEGLVAQIPALLVSLTAAILVSRINEPEKGGKPVTFGATLVGQLSEYPRALWTVSMVMGGFAMIPGMPIVAFTALSLLSGAIAYWVGRPKTVKKKREDLPTGKPGEVVVVHEFNQMEAMQFVMPTVSTTLSDTDAVVHGVHTARNKLVIELGMTLPGIGIKYDPALPANMVEFRVYEVPVFRTPLRSGYIGFSGPQGEELASREDAIVDAGVSVGGGNMVWLPIATVENDAELEGSGVTWTAFISEKLEQKILRYGPRFTGVQAGMKYITWMEGWMPELANEVKKAVPMSKLAEVIQRLLKERVSIRNMRLIMETLGDHGTRERDPAALTEFVRFSLREQICHQLAPQGRLSVFVLSPELEEHISTNIRQTATGGFLSLSPHEVNQISAAIRAVIVQREDQAQTPVLVCAQDVRRFVRNLLEPDLPEMVVLAVTELTPEISVNVISSIEMPGNEQYDDDDGEEYDE